MNNTQIARETLSILEQNGYSLGGEQIVLSPAPSAFREAELYTPERIDALSLPEKRLRGEILVELADSFEAAKKFGIGRTLVLNFANAYHAGGGFLYGSIAQEESLCRRSTLYASLTSERGKEMYAYNAAHAGTDGAQSMLLSPQTVVFRGLDGELFAPPYTLFVISAAAPDLSGDSRLLDGGKIAAVFDRRIGSVLKIAASCGYETVVLGAWGCGAFGNDAKDVAARFRFALSERDFRRYFSRVVFAIYESYNKYNFNSFRSAFSTDGI